MEKIEFTYEDIRNILIYDMRAKYRRESRPIYEVYQYYIGFDGCGSVAANVVYRALKHMSNDTYNTDLSQDLKALHGIGSFTDTIFSKSETIKKLTNNLESIWGIIKLARHMHLIKNTIHFEQQ